MSCCRRYRLYFLVTDLSARESRCRIRSESEFWPDERLVFRNNRENNWDFFRFKLRIIEICPKNIKSSSGTGNNRDFVESVLTSQSIRHLAVFCHDSAKYQGISRDFFISSLYCLRALSLHVNGRVLSADSLHDAVMLP